MEAQASAASSLTSTSYADGTQAVPNKLSVGTFCQEIAPKYQELNALFMDPSCSDESFEAHWNKAFEEGLVPFPADKLHIKVVDARVTGRGAQAKRVETYTGQKMLERAQAGDKPTELQWVISNKLNEAGKDANNAQNPIEPDLTPAECENGLRFLAYIECGADFKVGVDVGSYLNGASWFRDKVNYNSLKSDVEVIDQKQSEENAKAATGSLVGGKVVLPKTSDDTLVKPLRDVGNRVELEQSIIASLAIPMRQLGADTQVEIKVPDVCPEVKTYCDNSLGFTTYRIDPNDRSKNKFDLFTSDFNELGSFTEQMSAVFAKKEMNGATQKQVQSLHFSCRILLRELPQKPDLTEKNVDTMTRAQAQEAKVVDKWDRAQVITDTIEYMKEAKDALEGLARDFELGLYMEELPAYN